MLPFHTLVPHMQKMPHVPERATWRATIKIKIRHGFSWYSTSTRGPHLHQKTHQDRIESVRCRTGSHGDLQEKHQIFVLAELPNVRKNQSHRRRDTKSNWRRCSREWTLQSLGFA
jgi:hypothetical protein